jgi:hypothetical protein
VTKEEEGNLRYPNLLQSPNSIKFIKMKTYTSNFYFEEANYNWKDKAVWASRNGLEKGHN